MKRKIAMLILALCTLFTGAIYASTTLSTEPVDTDCAYTGNSRAYCGFGSYLVQNCIPEGDDCSFDEPEEPTEPTGTIED